MPKRQGPIRQLAAVLAFGDAYHVTFLAALVAIGLAVLLPGPRRGGAANGEGIMAGGH